VNPEIPSSVVLCEPWNSDVGFGCIELPRVLSSMNPIQPNPISEHKNLEGYGILENISPGEYWNPKLGIVVELTPREILNGTILIWR